MRYTITNAALKMNVQPALKNRQQAHYSLLIPKQSPYLGGKNSKNFKFPTLLGVFSDPYPY